MNRIRLKLVLGACCLLLPVSGWAQGDSKWMLGPFERPLDKPVISPRAESTFTDPVTGKTVHWEALHTFNPAAIVRGGKINRAVSRGRRFGRDDDRRTYFADWAGGE